jgi:MFS family permease
VIVFGVANASFRPVFGRLADLLARRSGRPGARATVLAGCCALMSVAQFTAGLATSSTLTVAVLLVAASYGGVFACAPCVVRCV